MVTVLLPPAVTPLPSPYSVAPTDAMASRMQLSDTAVERDGMTLTYFRRARFAVVGDAGTTSYDDLTFGSSVNSPVLNRWYRHLRMPQRTVGDLNLFS